MSEALRLALRAYYSALAGIREGTDGAEERAEQALAELNTLLAADAAAVADPPEPNGATAPDDVLSRARLSEYMHACSAGRTLEGATRELSDGLGFNGNPHLLPLELLLEDRADGVEDRVDAVTAVSAVDGTVEGQDVRPIIARVFAQTRSVTNYLGARFESVSGEVVRYPRQTGGTTAAFVAESTQVDAAAATFGSEEAEPHRVSAAYRLTMEAQARAGAQLESLLRADLRSAMVAAVDAAVLNGDGTGADPLGVFARLDDPDVTTAVHTPLGFRSEVTGALDGQYFTSEGNVRLLFGTSTYNLGRASIHTVLRRDGIQLIQDLGARVRPSTLIPAPASDDQQGLRFPSGSDALRIPTWGTLQLQRNPYHANQGEVRLTANLMLDVVMVHQRGWSQRTFHLA